MKARSGSAAGANEARERSTEPAGLDDATARAFARRALENIAREYPNHTKRVLEDERDVVPPRVAHPCFYGALDWHSAVHNHWLLARLCVARRDPGLRGEITAVLARSLTPANARAEAAYLERHAVFERPYGIAWLALLHAELAMSGDETLERCANALEPAMKAAAANVRQWLPRLRRPVRSGTHSQTAFALALLFDAADLLRDTDTVKSIRGAALRLFRDDANAPLHYEPSGEDFLSPCLMEADLMRRVLGTTDFAAWLDRFLPDLPERDADGWLACAETLDETDGHLVHLHGLNLSRAWNLANIAAALPPDDPRCPALRSAAERHRAAGVPAALAAEHYAGSHWLPTFAVYLLTGAGTTRV